MNFCEIDYPFIENVLEEWFHYRLDYTGPEITIKINGISYLLNCNLDFYYNGTIPHKHIVYEIRLRFLPLYEFKIMRFKTRREAEIEMIKLMIDVNTQLAKHYGVPWTFSIHDYPKRLEELVSEHIYGLDGLFYNQGVL